MMKITLHATNKIRARHIVIAALAVMLSYALLNIFYNPPPSDEYLISIFNKNRDTFRLLSEAIIKNNIEALEYGRGGVLRREDLKKFTTNEGENIYIDALDKIKCDFFTVGYNATGTKSHAISFVYASGGISSIGHEWGKGIEYISDDNADDGELRDNLDTLHNHVDYGTYRKKITNNWYIFYEYLD